MKTKLVRPLLLHSDEAVKIGSIMEYVKLSPIHDFGFDNPLGSLVLNVNPFIVKSNVCWQLNHLYLLSLDPDEKIEPNKDMFSPMDGCIINWDGDLTFTKNPVEYGYKKVVATHEQLSPELIKQLIEDYNNGGMKDFVIKMEDPNYWNHWSEGVKLTNGFITPITKEDKEEKLYTKADLEEAFWAGVDEGSRWRWGLFESWFEHFEQNKQQ